MIRNYFKIALRNLSRHKAYAAINIFGLALGLAACWMIVLYVADELSFDRFHTKADRIVRVAQHARWADNDLHAAVTSAPFAAAIKDAFPEVEDATRILTEGGGIISYNDKTLKADDIYFTDKNILNIFSFPLLYGDPATALSTPQSIVIDETLAVKLFGDAQKAMDQTIYFDKTFPNKITGVLKNVPLNSQLRFSALRSIPPDHQGSWQNSELFTYLLLKKGTSIAKLQSRMPQFVEQNIRKVMKVDEFQIELQPLTSIHLHSNLRFEISANGSISRVYMFTGIAALILLIAIINYINLSTARSASRIKEISVRKVVGSGRMQLGLMFLTESIVVTMIAAGLGILLVTAILPVFNQLTEKQLSFWRFGEMNTVLFLLAFSVIIGFISGVYPSLFMSRFKTIPALKGQMGDLAASLLFRKSLVVFQFVITIAMIAGSLILYSQLRYTSQKDLGFNKNQVLTFHIDNRELREHTDAVKEQLLKNPAIEAVAVAGNPIGNNDLGGNGYYYETADGSFSTNTIMAQELMVDADYMPAMEIKVEEGRNFSATAGSDKDGAALINETLKKKLGWTNAEGKKIKFIIDEKGNTAERTIIGVVKDFHTYSLQHLVDPMVMVMPARASQGDNFYVKIAKGKIPEGLAALEKTYRRFDKTSPIDFHFLDANFAKQYKAEEKQGQIALVFTMLAVLIACLGLFGLATFTAEQRTKEIGVRKVLGASVAGIVQMLSADFLKLVLVAACIALPLAWMAMNQWLQDFAYRVNISVWLLLSAAVAAMVIALLTVSFQAIKAAMANPVKSLRTE